MTPRARAVWPRGCEGNCAQGDRYCDCWIASATPSQPSRRWFAACPIANRTLAGVLVVGFVVAVISALTGCGGGGDDSSADARKKPTPPTCLVKPETCA